MKTATSSLAGGFVGGSGLISIARKSSARPPAASIACASRCASEPGLVTTTPLPFRLTEQSLKDVPCPLAAQILGCPLGQRVGFPRLPRPVGARDTAAVGCGNQCA